jgi:hypothetical protein
VEGYPDPAEVAVIKRGDLVATSGIANTRLLVLSEILLWEAPLLNGSRGGAADHWISPVDDRIVNYWEVRTPDDYLRIRANELRPGSDLSSDASAPPSAAMNEPGETPVLDSAPRDEQASPVLGRARGE